MLQDHLPPESGLRRLCHPGSILWHVAALNPISGAPVSYSHPEQLPLSSRRGLSEQRQSTTEASWYLGRVCFALSGLSVVLIRRSQSGAPASLDGGVVAWRNIFLGQTCTYPPCSRHGPLGTLSRSTVHWWHPRVQELRTFLKCSYLAACRRFTSGSQSRSAPRQLMCNGPRNQDASVRGAMNRAKDSAH